MPNDRAAEERLASTEQALRDARERLDSLRESHTKLRERLETVEKRLRRSSHAVLSEDVLRHLLPARVEAWKRQRRDETAAQRDRRHAEISVSYRREISSPAPMPSTFRQVSILGLKWSLPPDRGPASRLTERMLREDWLPLGDVLQTREVTGGGVMLDIGANIGTTSIPRIMLGDAAVVYAAEPEPANFSCLVRNIVDNGVRGVVLPDQVAIDDRSGRVALKLAPTIGAHSVIDGEAGMDSVEVEAVTLDRWVERSGIDSEAIRFIKVDTQGRESHVLSGAPGLTARRHVAWQLEFAPALLRQSGREPTDFLAQLQSAFSWFIDMHTTAEPPRVRPIEQLREALGYVRESFTNVIVYRG
jgi:FkbM family methyltransferase